MLSYQDTAGVPVPWFVIVHESEIACCVTAEAGPVNAVGVKSGLEIVIGIARSLFVSSTSYTAPPPSVFRIR